MKIKKFEDYGNIDNLLPDIEDWINEDKNKIEIKHISHSYNSYGNFTILIFYEGAES